MIVLLLGCFLLGSATFTYGAACPRYTLVGYETDRGSFQLLDLKSSTCTKNEQPAKQASPTNSDKKQTNTNEDHAAASTDRGGTPTLPIAAKLLAGIGTAVLIAFLMAGQAMRETHSYRPSKLWCYRLDRYQ